MKCPKCQMPNQKWAAFCSACGEKLNADKTVSVVEQKTVPNGSEITINVVEKKAPKKLGCFGVILVIVFVSLIFSAISGNSKSETASTPEPTNSQGSYCAILMKSLNESVEYMGNAGTTYSIGDVAAVLEKRGSALATGFDVDMAGSPERLAVIQDAGKQLLQIRVRLLDGGDITPSAEAFKQDFEYIAATCE